MPSHLDTIASRFGHRWWTPPLFYNHSYSLRFELGQESDFWLEYLEVAKLRACTVMDVALGSSGPLLLAIARYQQGPESSTQEQADLRDALGEYGLPELSAFEAEVHPEDDADGYVWLGVAELESAHRGRVVWASIACEFGYLPSTPGAMYLLSLTKDLICHPYDARGMDVLGTTASSLADLYTTHNEWLLDYDRVKMDSLFAKQSRSY
ncbi:MAG: DUF3885 domain-containing protein [Phycisphaerales bacterium]